MVTGKPMLLTPSTTIEALMLPAVGSKPLVKVKVSELLLGTLEMLPTAPSLRVRTSLAFVVSKPAPLIVTDGAGRNRVARVLRYDRRDRFHLRRRAGLAVAGDRGRHASHGRRIGKERHRKGVRSGAGDPATTPTAPLLRTTVFCDVLKPKPLMTSGPALAAVIVVLLVTTGVSRATWTGVPLVTPSVVTTADSGPAVIVPALPEMVAMSEVNVTLVTVPAQVVVPLVNETEFVPFGSKP